MKKTIFLSLALLAFALAKNYQYQLREFSKEIYEWYNGEDEAAEHAAMAQPNDFFEAQRAFPDAELDAQTFHAALAQAQTDAQNTQARTTMAGTWTTQGPGNIGARVNTIALHPTNENIVLLGYAAGGIWRTTNGGTSWLPVFDAQQQLAISDIKFQTSNPNTIWAATGDANFGGYSYLGNGIFKSTNGGTTWTNMGLTNVGVVSKIAMHPTNPNIIYAATLGNVRINDANRGVYKTTNGGTTWTKVLNTGTDAGAIDIVMDFSNPNILYASAWNRTRGGNISTVNGTGAKIYKTTNGGTTWTALNGGLPTGAQGRIGLAQSQQNANKLYAVYVGTDSNFSDLMQTTDGGTTWTRLETIENDLPNDIYKGFGWYFGWVRINPTNDDEIYLGGVELWKKNAGDLAWARNAPEWWTYEVHADAHDMAFAPSGKVFLATDGGVYTTVNEGTNWIKFENTSNTQFYKVAYNPHDPTNYFGGAQDNGTSGGNLSTYNEWTRIYGGDGFTCAFHPTNPNITYASSQNGTIVRSTDGGINFNSIGASILDETYNWSTPYFQSPHNPEVVFLGASRVYRASDVASDNFVAISGVLPDSTSFNSYRTLSTIDQSPLNAQNIYAGSANAGVFRTINGGTTWQKVSATLPFHYVTSVKASPTAANTVFVSHSGYRNNDYIPHIHKSSNNGTTWTSIAANLPNLAINDIWIMPNSSDQVLIVATDGGVYGTLNGGISWQRIGTNMPFVPVFDIDYNVSQRTIIAGTFARGIMTIPLSSFVNTSVFAATLPLALNVFPTISSDKVHVQTNSPDLQNASAQVQIFDTKGALISSQTITIGSDDLSLRSCASGIYFIKIQTSTGRWTGKVVKP